MTDLKCTECGHDAAQHDCGYCKHPECNAILTDCLVTEGDIYRAEIERLSKLFTQGMAAILVITEGGTPGVVPDLVTYRAVVDLKADRDRLAARVKELEGRVENQRNALSNLIKKQGCLKGTLRKLQEQDKILRQELTARAAEGQWEWQSESDNPFSPQTKGCSIEGCPNLADEVYVEGGYCVEHPRPEEAGP